MAVLFPFEIFESNHLNAITLRIYGIFLNNVIKRKSLPSGTKMVGLCLLLQKQLISSIFRVLRFELSCQLPWLHPSLLGRVVRSFHSYLSRSRIHTSWRNLFYSDESDILLYHFVHWTLFTYKHNKIVARRKRLLYLEKNHFLFY